jgi:hypothetical protein
MNQKLFEQIYLECVIQPLFEQIFQEGIKRVKATNDIEDYVSNINVTFNNPNYKYLNSPKLNTKEKFDNEVNEQIKFIQQKRKTNDGKEQFRIYRIFEDKSQENIGYITCTKQIRNNGKIIILDLKIFRDLEHLVNNGGISVLDELEKLIKSYFQNEKVKQVEFTCIKGNPMENAYDARFLNSQNYKCFKKYDKHKKNDNLIYYAIKSFSSSKN